MDYKNISNNCMQMRNLMHKKVLIIVEYACLLFEEY